MARNKIHGEYRRIRRDLVDKLESFDSVNFRSCISRQNIRRKALEQNAQYHLFKMDSNIPSAYCFSKKEVRKFFKEGLEDVKGAFKWGRNTFRGYNFSEDFIKELNYRVVPKLYLDRIADYRDSDVFISGATSIPPSSRKVKYEEMPNFVYEVKNRLNEKDLLSVVDTSIYAHLNLVRIHPFEDGNGRTSRLLQNIILSNSRIPLPVINYRERAKYCSLLDDAVKDINLETCENEGVEKFSLFMYEKINSSLDKVLK